MLKLNDLREEENKKHMKNMQVCFVNTEEEPLKVEHICFDAEIDEENVHLFKIERITYSHPETKELSVSVFQRRKIGTRRQNEFESAPYMLLYFAQKNAHKAR